MSNNLRYGDRLAAPLLAAVLLAAGGCQPGGSDAKEAKPVVAVTRVVRADLARELSFQAEFRPWFTVDLQAKVAGFVKALAVDIGDRVKAGQVLAELEIPRLAEDIARAEANVRRSDSEVQRARAAFDDAHQTYNRLMGVAKSQPRLLAQQEIDSATARDRGAAAALAAAQQQVQVSQAELDRLKSELGDTKIVAPFDGTVTRLDASPGGFVQGGLTPSGQARPLLRLAQLSRLRLSFPVSISYASLIHEGDPVEIRFSDGRRLTNRVARFSHEVSPADRMMAVEADVPNDDLAIIPGVYATAVIRPERREMTLVTAIEGLIRKGGQTTALVVTANGVVENRVVKTGLETSKRVEALDGLKEGDWVVIGGAGRVKEGQTVEPKIVAETATE